MAITIDERELRGTAIPVVTGRLTSTESRGDLKNAVRGLIERGRKENRARSQGCTLSR
jgi:hypothetical protein